MRLTKSTCFSEQFHSFLFQKHIDQQFPDPCIVHNSSLSTPNLSCRCQSWHKYKSLFNTSNHPWQHKAGCHWEPLPPKSHPVKSGEDSQQTERIILPNSMVCDPPFSSSILFCTAKGQHVPKSEPNQGLSRLTHSLDGRLAQIRHTSVLPH